VARRANDQTELLFSTLQDSVFGSLYRASLDDLPGWLRLEYRRLFRERIDALPRFCGGLLDDNQFSEAGHKERSRFLEFFVAYFGERLDHALNVLSRHVVRMLLSNFLNELRLRHQLRHALPPASESVRDYVSLIRSGGNLPVRRDAWIRVAIRAQMAAPWMASIGANASNLSSGGPLSMGPCLTIRAAAPR